MNNGISPKVLKMSSSQLCEIFCTIYNLSFLCGFVPDIWKRYCIVPVPKKNKVVSMNDLRPVALTSAAIKYVNETCYQNANHLFMIHWIHSNLHTKIIEIGKMPY